MKIKPTNENLKAWKEIYVPEKDLFFLTKENLKSKIDVSDVLLMPADEFFNHNTFKQINYVNSYLYWNIKDIDYVIIAEKNWIENISSEEKKVIFNSQIQCGRGLVVPATFVNELEKIPSNYIVNQNIIIQRAMWELLDDAVKEQLLNRIVYEWWDNGNCEVPPNSMFSFLKPFANTFSNQQGANCLAAALFAISNGKQNWFIYEWIHQKTFIEALNRYNYEVFSGDVIQDDDVVVWQDKNGIIQHAAYHIGDSLYFNKDGQTIFNPWKILNEEQLFKDWEHLTPIKYRRY
ncbi:hypothetical protein GLV94_01345 [Virgibacillus halodenitrificans]|uniref:hypothetical protein n=1 Tax=Virgibacillus halodenitrificans TaxID=1482 RepID=UPI00136F75D3|nr:hypothetical protein [Virgibacillus halodenitrificans]MYL44280.1 hypothetical protein [Virgibacillus halodenitrificans]